MPLTRSFKDLVKTRAARDPRFRKALLRDGVELFVQGDTAEGKAALRAYVNATVGFEKLGKAVGKKPQSLMRMLSPSGNPTAENLFAVIAYLQEREGVKLHVAPRAVGAK
jgi:DNA-binding phage protein